MKQKRAGAIEFRDESGATLIWVAILSVVLFGMAAFAVDAGLGYTVKRKLSATADSAALAGALEAVRTYSGGSCNTAAIEAAVQANHTANNPTSAALPTIGSGIEIDCAELSVTVHETSTLDSVFGRILGVETLHPGASATAKASGSSTASGMRPFTVCLWDALRAAEDSHASTAMQATVFVGAAQGGQPNNDPLTVQCQPTGAPGAGGWAFFDLQNASTQTIANLIQYGYGGWAGSPRSFDVGDRQRYEGGPHGWPNPNPPLGDPVVESAANKAATLGSIGRGDTGANVRAQDIKAEARALVGQSVLLPTAEYWTDDPGRLWPNGKVYQGFGAIKARIQGVVIRRGSSNQVDADYSAFTSACNVTRFALFAAPSGTYAGNAPEITCRDRAVTLLQSSRDIRFILFWTYDGRWTASPFSTGTPCNPADITCGWRVSLTG